MLGKFVFHVNTNSNNHGGSSFNILHKPTSLHLAPNPGSIQIDEVAPVVALSLGLSVPKDVKWAGLQVNNPFKMAKASLMITIDCVPKGKSLAFSSLASYPLVNTADVGSIDELYRVAPKYTLASHVSGIFEGASKIVSISGDERIAGSGHTTSRLTETSVWSEMTKSWKVVSGDGEVKTSLSRSELLKRVPGVLFSGFTYDHHDNMVHVNVQGMDFSYNLNKEVDFALFSELVYISYQASELAAHGKSWAKDGTPDVYLLSVSALKGLEKKYGPSSKQVKGALLLIEKFVAKTVKKFVDLYDGEIFVVGVQVASKSGIFEEYQSEMQSAFKVLENNNIITDAFGSEIHLVNQMEAEAQRKLCEAVRATLGQLSKSVDFKCAHDLPVHKLHKRSLMNFPVMMAAGAIDANADGDLNLGSDYNDNFPVIFNIWFWLFVVLALTVYVVSIGMWNMDPGRDSIIYRLTQQKIKSD